MVLRDVMYCVYVNAQSCRHVKYASVFCAYTPVCACVRTRADVYAMFLVT